MIKNSYRVVGVMSGTSLDGIDLALINFSINDRWEFQLLECETWEYPQIWKKELKHLVHLTKDQLTKVDDDYTQYLSTVIKNFIDKHNLTHLDAVSSHGHTALHRPDLGYTVQIGNKKELAKLINQRVVCDFRVQDVEYGGQGAPLVPMGDQLLFSDYDYCLNLGGFANISTKLNNQRVAYDVCPVNIVLNKYAELLGMSYDENGQRAAQGELNVELLNHLNTLPFYLEMPPKSLGLEWVNQNIIPILESSNLNTLDILRTFTEHIAVQLTKNITSKRPSKVLVTGGGAYNAFLMERLSSLSNASLEIPSKKLIEYKEALIFGLLGVLRLRNEINVLSSVTGAKADHCSGVIYEP